MHFGFGFGNADNTNPRLRRVLALRSLLLHRDAIAGLVKGDFIHERPHQQDAATTELFEICRIGRIGQRRGIETGSLIANGNLRCIVLDDHLDIEPAVTIGSDL